MIQQVGINVMLFLFCTQLIGQNTFNGFISAGAVTSQISGDGFYGFGQYGVKIGLGSSISLRGKSTIVGELGFSQKGARKYQSSSDFTTYQLRLDLVNASIRLEYPLCNDFFIGSGFLIEIPMNSKEVSQFGPINTDRPFNRILIGYMLAFGKKINQNFSMDLGLENSILPVRKHDQTQVYPPNNLILGDWHNNILNKGQFLTAVFLSFHYHF